MGRTSKSVVAEERKKRIGTGRKKPAQFHLNELLPYLVNRVASATTQLFSRDIAQFDLSVPMWRVIAVLSEMGEQRLVDLAAMTSVDASTLSRLVEVMQADELIAKVRSKESRREIVLTISPRGKELARILAPVAAAYEARLTENLPAQDLATMRRVLNHMYEQLRVLKAQAHLDSRPTRRQMPVLAKNLLQANSAAKRRRIK